MNAPYPIRIIQNFYICQMRYKEFVKKITEDVDYYKQEGADYNLYHARRFYKTYKVCSRYLKKGNRIMSLGAGTACVEKILSQENNVEVTVVDFPEVIEGERAYYEYLGFKMIAANLSEDQLNLPHDYFDLLLFSEVVEHVPVPPQDQLRKFDACVKKNGKLVITTPNLGSIMHIIKLLLMQPLLEPPERTFSKVIAENQAVHRREYMPREIVDAFKKIDYRHILTEYFLYTYPKKLHLKLLYAVTSIIPRFKLGMLLVGEK